MKHAARRIVTHCLFTASMLFAIAIASLPHAAQAASSQIREAQTRLVALSIPTGPVDGIYGPQTARGLCAFRALSGLKVHRGNVDAATLRALRSYSNQYTSLSSIPAPHHKGAHTYIVVHKTCQTMTYVEQKRFVRVMPVSTGKSGHDTPSGNYMLGNTQRGWHCSSEYPESCRKQTTGKFASVSNYGNMYNMRFFRHNGYFVHGSTSVPTYPASHGCIRVTVADADWMYNHVGNNGKVPMLVTGRY